MPDHVTLSSATDGFLGALVGAVVASAWAVWHDRASRRREYLRSLASEAMSACTNVMIHATTDDASAALGRERVMWFFHADFMLRGQLRWRDRRLRAALEDLSEGLEAATIGPGEISYDAATVADAYREQVGRWLSHPHTTRRDKRSGLELLVALDLANESQAREPVPEDDTAATDDR